MDRKTKKEKLTIDNFTEVDGEGVLEG